MFRRLIPFRRRHRDQVLEERHPDIELIRMLASQISIPSKAGPVLGEVEAFIRLKPPARRRALPRVYLLLEQYLTDMDPSRAHTRTRLRKLAREDYPSLTEEPSFRIIFESQERQELLLCRALLSSVLDGATEVLGEGAKLSAIKAWIRHAPNPVTDDGPTFPFDGDPSRSETDSGSAHGMRPASDAEWIAAFMAVSPTIFEQLHIGLGEATARIYDGAYTEMARRYGGLETFPIVVRLLPDGLLDAERIQSVARHGTMSRVQGALSEAQQSALESATQLQAVLSTVGEGIATVDAERRFVFVNREIERLFGYRSDDLLGRPISLLLDGIEDAFAKSLGERIQIEGRRSDGSTFPVEVCINETTISGKLFYTAAVRDVTTRLRYERELLRAKEHAEEMTRLKTAFLANMSHEFRTPLAGIMGAVDILVDEIPDSMQEFAEVISDSGRRLLSTFDSVLEFAVLESGDPRVELRPVAIQPLLEAAAQRFAARALSKGLKIHVDLPDEAANRRNLLGASDEPGPPRTHDRQDSLDSSKAGAAGASEKPADPSERPAGPTKLPRPAGPSQRPRAAEQAWALADPECIDRILDRLLENAIRFTHDGSIWVSARVQDGQVRIEVRDTGIGIGPSFLPHAFDEFRQESSGDARKHEGTGLGLAIARRLAEQMGGGLEADSSPGEGSTFRLSLQATEPKTNPSNRAHATPQRHVRDEA